MHDLFKYNYVDFLLSFLHNFVVVFLVPGKRTENCKTALTYNIKYGIVQITG